MPCFQGVLGYFYCFFEFTQKTKADNSGQLKTKNDVKNDVKPKPYQKMTFAEVSNSQLRV